MEGGSVEDNNGGEVGDENERCAGKGVNDSGRSKEEQVGE